MCSVFGIRKLESLGYNTVNCLMMSSYTRVTDRRTDGRTDIARQHISRYAYALRDKK